LKFRANVDGVRRAFPGRATSIPGYLEKRDRIFRVIGMSLRVGDTAAA
jgi:hypothetical protein